MGKAKDSTGTELATSDQKRLDELEAIIAAGFQGFAEAGQALKAVRDEKLYRATHKTFEAYHLDVWGLSSSQTYRLMEASGVAQIASPIGEVPSEAVARELAPLKDEPEKLIGAWQRAVEEHGKPTAAQVRKIVQPEAPAEPPLEPIAPGEVEVDRPIVATATAKPVGALDDPKPPSIPSLEASVTRAVRAALKGGVSLRRVSELIEGVVRDEST